MKSNKLAIVLLVLAFAGLMDASYLTIQHYTNGSVNCSLAHGCEQVLTSKYSVISGVPLSLLGAIYYIVLFFSMVAFLDTKKQIFIKAVSLISGLGLMMSGFLVYQQIAVLKSICIYCMFSATMTFMLFFISLLLNWYNRDRLKVYKETNVN